MQWNKVDNYEFCELKCDEGGKIIPDQAAVDAVEREYPDAERAEKYRLAQADVLIRSLCVRRNGSLVPKYVRKPGANEIVYIENPALTESR